MKILSASLLACIWFAGAADGREVRHARKPPDMNAVLTSLEARRFKALVEGDLVTLDRMLADDLTYTHATGWTQSKSELLESLRSGKLRYLSIEPANEKVRAYGTTAVGTGRAVFKVRLEGKELNVQLRFIDVYVRRHGRWQLVAWQSTRLNP
jgi:Domain of unknown function (DUF4440)